MPGSTVTPSEARAATKRLAARAIIRRAEALVHADAAVLTVTKDFIAWWQELLALVAAEAPASRLRPHLQKIGPRVVRLVREILFAGADRDWKSAKKMWDGALPPTWTKHLVQLRRFGEAEGDAGTVRVEGVAVFEPPSKEKVSAWVNNPNWLGDGRGWSDRLEELSHKITDKDAALNAITNGYAAGKNIAQIAADLQPIVSGLKVSATRVARTESMRIAEEAQRECYRQADDLISGYQIWAVLDDRTRPEHAARSGRMYTKDGCPLVPDEPNCRCTTAPILRDPEDVLPPAMRGEFTEPITVVNGTVHDLGEFQNWFDAQTPTRQKALVGVARFGAVSDKVGRKNVAWAHFIDSDGAMNSAMQLANTQRSVLDARKQAGAAAVKVPPKVPQSIADKIPAPVVPPAVAAELPVVGTPPAVATDLAPPKGAEPNPVAVYLPPGTLDHVSSEDAWAFNLQLNANDPHYAEFRDKVKDYLYKAALGNGAASDKLATLMYNNPTLFIGEDLKATKALLAYRAAKWSGTKAAKKRFELHYYSLNADQKKRLGAEKHPTTLHTATTAKGATHKPAHVKTPEPIHVSPTPARTPEPAPTGGAPTFYANEAEYKAAHRAWRNQMYAEARDPKAYDEGRWGAIKSWKNSQYGKVRRHQAGQSLDESDKKRAEKILAGLNHATATAPTKNKTLYRGISSGDPRLVDKFTLGSEVVWPEYSSSSSDKSTAGGFLSGRHPILFQIESKSAVDLDALHHGVNEGESEWLLRPNVRYRVARVKKNVLDRKIESHTLVHLVEI